MAVGCSQTSVIARDTPPFPAFFDVAVTKFTHAAESSQNVPTREGNEAQNGKETRRRARVRLFLNGLNLMAHVSRWVIGSCWVIGSLNLTWVDWVNWVIGSRWVIKIELGHWVS